QGEADAFPKPGEVAVDVSELSDVERALIVYRHARASEFVSAARDLIRQAAAQIVRHPHFTPQRIALLMRDGIPAVMDGSNENRVRLLHEEIRRRIGEPTRQMRQSLEALSPAHRDVLVA